MLSLYSFLEVRFPFRFRFLVQQGQCGWFRVPLLKAKHDENKTPEGGCDNPPSFIDCQRNGLCWVQPLHLVMWIRKKISLLFPHALPIILTPPVTKVDKLQAPLRRGLVHLERAK